MKYETASLFQEQYPTRGEGKRGVKAKRAKKRGNLAAAVKAHQALIAKRGTVSELDNAALDIAISNLVSEAKMTKARGRR